MKRWVKGALNAGYWLLYLLLLFMFFVLMFAINVDKGGAWSMKAMLGAWLKGIAVFALIPGILGFYGGYGYLFSRYLQKRKLKTFFAGLFFWVTLIAVFSFVFSFAILEGRTFSSITLEEVFYQMVFMGFVGLVNATIGIVLRGFIASYDDIMVKEALMEKNREVEMELVRAQLNPHFLFNTINNIDVMISQDPHRASECLVKLSEIMRYMLYESKDDRMDAGVEINYIQRYIELQQLRTDIPDFVEFELQGDGARHTLAPMTLIPFIENAFKYAEHVRESGAVRILLALDTHRLFFKCSNRFDGRLITLGSGGLGNELIAQRLRLLYGDRYSLKVSETNGVYDVELGIQA